MAAGSRIAVLLALSPVVLLTASCALFFPPSLSVSVRPSVLASYNDRPLWQWSVSRAESVVGVEVALDGGRYLEFEPTARSFRAPEPLSPGMHLLTVRIGTGGFGGRSVRKSSAVRVAALPALPVGFPDDAVDLWALELVRLPEVWQAFATGRLPVPRPVMVAVVDTGYLLHPDLDANLDPAAGYDFIKDLTEANDGDGIDPDALDEGAFGHGTAVAGVIAAETNNGQDVAGMDWSTGTRGIITIMPVRALGQEGTDYDLAQSVRYAAGLQNDSGTRPLRPAKIINLSLTDPDVVATVPVVQSALYQATQAGSIVVAAAGNASGPVTAPASSGCTLAVGAIRSDRSLASYSNFGSEIDVVAPGGDSDRRIEVLALRPAQGTSLAAPYVSGALALLASIAPSVTLEQARALLADTAVDLGPSGRDRHYGPGMLDVVALLGAYPPRPGAAVSSLRCGPPGPTPALGADSVAVAPANADPRTLVVRWSGPSRRGAARGAVAAELRDRHRIGEVSAGDGEYSLVQLQPDQDLVSVKARLEADPAVASVHFNGRYRPTMTAAAESVGRAVEAAEGVHGGAYRGVGKGSPTAPAQQLVDAQGG